jgi:hypothetical protein
VGVASKAHRLESVSGDAWLVQSTLAGVRVSLVDGVGHGSAAAEAAATALAVLEEHPEDSPAEVLRACHGPLRHTRGAVMAVALFGPGLADLHVAGVGNVEGHLWTPAREELLVMQRGMLGLNIPTIRPLQFPLGKEWILVLHTDGVSARFKVSQYMDGELAALSADELAGKVLANHGREDDDAAVVVVVP